jgi:hypothetical protein
MTAEERESLFDQMCELPDTLKHELLVDAFAKMESIQDEHNYSLHHSGTFFEHVAYVNDQYLEGKLD